MIGPIIILAVLVVFVISQQKSAVAQGTAVTSAANRRPVTTAATGAAQTTNALSSIEKALTGLLGGSGGSSRMPVSGGGPGPTNTGPSQTGFNQPSLQTVNTLDQTIASKLPPSGQTDPLAIGPPYTDPITGQVYDANGNLVGDSPIAGIVAQTAPGDGGTGSLSSQDTLSLLTSPTGTLDTTGNQDTALLIDASAAPYDPLAGISTDLSGFGA